MTADSDDEPTRDVQQQMSGEADRMQARLEKLDDHIGEAKKKAQEGRPQGDTPDRDPLEDAAGAGEDHDEHVDDPEGPLIGPE